MGFGLLRRVFAPAGGFDPAALELSLYLKDYAAMPWDGTPSLGVSGSVSFDVPGPNPVVVGATFGAHSSATFGGTTYLTNSGGLELGDLVTVSAYSFNFVVSFPTASAPAVDHYLDPTLIGDQTDGDIYVTYNTDGVRAGHLSGGVYQATPAIPLATGVKACIQVVYDGTDVRVRVNGCDAAGNPGWESATIGNIPGGAMSHTPILGAGYAAIGKIAADIALAQASKLTLDDATFDAMLADAQAHYGVP